MAVWGVVVAGGSGSRFGLAKQFVEMGDRRLVDRAVAVATRSCDAVVVVVPAGTEWDGPTVECTVQGGETRAESVRSGLAVVPDDVEVIVVHDAARPLASDALFASVIDAVRRGADAAVPGIVPADTVKRVRDDRVIETLDRDTLIMAQTPQAFRAGALRAAHARDEEATDDAGLVERDGGTVVVVAGEPRNVKVTTADDLRVAASLDLDA